VSSTTAERLSPLLARTSRHAEIYAALKNEGGEQEFHRQHVRAELEYTCSECQTTLRTLPANCGDYDDEVAVLETEQRAAPVVNSASWGGGSGGGSQCGRRGWHSYSVHS